MGTVEDAVGADSFPEVFVDVVIRAAVDEKKQPTGQSDASRARRSKAELKKKKSGVRLDNVKDGLTCPSGLPGRGWGLCGRSFERKGCWG